MAYPVSTSAASVGSCAPAHQRSIDLAGSLCCRLESYELAFNDSVSSPSTKLLSKKRGTGCRLTRVAPARSGLFGRCPGANLLRWSQISFFSDHCTAFFIIASCMLASQHSCPPEVK